MFRAASLAALAVLAALVAACGGGAASGEADPASAVPADAPFYLEAVVRPEGDLREDALDAAGKVLRTDDPSGKISELLDKALKEDGDTKLDYEKDIEPWLGERAGVLGQRTGQGERGRGPEGAVIIAITDQDAAQAAVDKARKSNGDRMTNRSYAGHRLSGRPGRRRDRRHRGLPDRRPGGAVQAHARHAEGRQAARRLRPLHATGRTASRTTASGTSTSTSSSC